MSIISFFITNLLPYFTIVIFIGGLIYRIQGWINTPLPMPLSVTYPKSRIDQIIKILREILLFPSLIKNDRNLWIGAWPFHAALAIIILGHSRLFTTIPDKILFTIGFTPTGIKALSTILGGIAGIVIMFSLMYLLARRFTEITVRNMSNPMDYLILIWLLGIVIAGNYMHFYNAPYTDIAEMRTYLKSIFILEPIAPPGSTVLLIHMFLVQILLISLPFTKLIHPIGIFFTQGIKNSLVLLRNVK